jgi:hypothetical protein
VIAFVQRQPTRYIWPVFVLADLLFIFSRHGQFRGYWLWTADWTAGTVILVGPLAAAVAAWHARFQMKHLREATLIARTRVRAVSGVLSGQLGLLLTAHLVCVVVAVVYTASANGSPDHLAHFLPQFFVLAGFIAAGTIAGFLLPTPYTAPVVGVLGFLVQLPQVGVLPRALVKFGGATANLVGLSARTSFDVAHTAFGLGLVLFGAVAATWVVTRRRPASSVLVAGTVGAAVLVSSFTFLVRTDAERFTVPTTVSVKCSKAQPVDVCLPSDVEALRGRLTGLIGEVNGLQARLGVAGLPSRVVVVPAGASPGAYAPGEATRPMVLQGDDLSGSKVDALKGVLPYLLIDRRCLDMNAHNDLSVAVPDLQVAADMVLLALVSDPPTAALPEVKILRSWAAARRNAWIRDVLTSANRCQLTKMPPVVQ